MKAIVQQQFGPPDVLRLVGHRPAGDRADDVLVQRQTGGLRRY
jgi:hypothetical protein